MHLARRFYNASIAYSQSPYIMQAPSVTSPLRRFFSAGLIVVVFLILAQPSHAASLEQIQKLGSIKIALYKANQPFSDGNNQDPSGLDVDIAKALGKELGLKPDWLLFDAGEDMKDDLRNMVWKGHYLGYGPADVMLHVPVDKFFMSANDQAFIFAPYYRERFVFLYRKADFEFLENGADLKGKTLSVARGSAAASALFAAEQGNLTPLTKIAVDGVEAADWVTKGKSSAAYVTRAEAEAALHRVPSAEQGAYRIKDMALKGTPANGWPIGMAVKAENLPLAKVLDLALDKIKANGQLAELFKKHGISLVQP